jgi:glycosyltransferase involved in cell wall biosynthesis
MYKIAYISDFSLGDGGTARSGYAGIGMTLCEELHKLGHDVKALGLGYTGQEHTGSFSLIPCATPQDTAGTLNNLKFMWQPDVVVVAMDIHHWQEAFFPPAQKLGMKYICVTALESEPLCTTWAGLLQRMDKVFFISQLGADEAQKAGVDAEHIRIGIDTKSWRMRTEEEYKAVRSRLGYKDDDFVILTVADNQERKNLSRGMEIVAHLKCDELGMTWKEYVDPKTVVPQSKKYKHIVVTRENSQIGWKLYDLAAQLRISSDFRSFNVGLPFADLYALYACSDAYLSASKGEGLGLPIMESLSVGLPVVANAVGAIPELLEDGRGFTVQPDYAMIDPFGNQNRYFMNIPDAVLELKYVNENKDNLRSVIIKAREYAESRTWDIPAKQIENAIARIIENGQTNHV